MNVFTEQNKYYLKNCIYTCYIKIYIKYIENICCLSIIFIKLKTILTNILKENKYM